MVRVLPRFDDLFADAVPDIVAVDMPIGLPERVQGSGRGPEQLVRPLLGARQSSVFAIPARCAVEAADYAEACARALAASDPPRKVSKQDMAKMVGASREMVSRVMRDLQTQGLIQERDGQLVLVDLSSHS